MIQLYFTQWDSSGNSELRYQSSTGASYSISRGWQANQGDCDITRSHRPCYQQKVFSTNYLSSRPINPAWNQVPDITANAVHTFW